jgi:hypothetical protein
LLQTKILEIIARVSVNHQITRMTILLKNISFILLAFIHCTASFGQTKAKQKVAQTTLRRLIRGHWISRDDNKAHLVFSDSVMTDLYNNEIVDTSDYWFGDNDKLFAKQKNEGDTLTYAIISLSKTTLTLMYLPRGNLLKFKRK